MDKKPTDTVDTQATWLALDRVHVERMADDLRLSAANQLEALVHAQVIETDLESMFYLFAALAVTLAELLGDTDKEHRQANLDLFVAFVQSELQQCK